MRDSLLQTPWSTRLFNLEIRPRGARHSGATKIFAARWGFKCKMGLGGDTSPQSNSCWVVSATGVIVAVDCMRQMLQTTFHVPGFPSNLSTSSHAPTAFPWYPRAIVQRSEPPPENAYKPHPSPPRTAASHGPRTRSARTHTAARIRACHRPSQHLTRHPPISSHP